MEKQIIPVLLGADLNCYNVARAFHEAYGVVSHAFGKYAVGASNFSKIVDFHIVKDLDNPHIMVDTLNSFAALHEDATLILLGCTNDYAELIIRNKSFLGEKYITPYIDAPLAELLVDKADFYTMCDRYNILYPKTVVLDRGYTAAMLAETAIGFPYPVIIKPSSSIEYWKHPFEGMKKVYVADNRGEAEKILSDIYKSGYTARMIVQDFIPGDDSRMYVLTLYSGKDKKVKLSCLGHVLLEEHTPKGLGNHTAILTESNPSLVARFVAMLDDLGYTGFSNFDIKYDERDGSYRAFEINLRQGRSNYYLTAAGHNIAELLVRDYSDEPLEYSDCTNEHLWYAIPRGVINKYVHDKKLLDRAKRAVREGRATSSLWYAPDIKSNPKRLAYVLAHLKNQYKKYRTYYK